MTAEPTATTTTETPTTTTATTTETLPETTKRRRRRRTPSPETTTTPATTTPLPAKNRNLPKQNNIVPRQPPVCPPNGTRPASAPHPSKGGIRGYAQEMRDQVIYLWMNGENLNAELIELLQHQSNSPARKLAGGGSVSMKERVTLVAGGQLAIISPSARSTVKTSSI